MLKIKMWWPHSGHFWFRYPEVLQFYSYLYLEFIISIFPTFIITSVLDLSEFTSASLDTWKKKGGKGNFMYSKLEDNNRGNQQRESVSQFMGTSVPLLNWGNLCRVTFSALNLTVAFCVGSRSCLGDLICGKTCDFDKYVAVSKTPRSHPVF